MKARNGDVELAWEQVGSGSPLLLIHGLGYARWGWEPLVPLLAEHFLVISFDNRGIGESDVPDGPYTAGDMAGDALAVLDAANVTRAHVVGTSLGGMIAQELAIETPARVDRLVLLSTTPGASLGHPMPQETIALLEEASSLEPAVALKKFVENALGTNPDTETVEQILEHRLSNPQDPGGWAAQAHAGTTYDGKDGVHLISNPTLVMTGTEDRVVDPANSQVLADSIPEATLETVEGGGHLFFWEYPEQTAITITGFLS
ncbi:MAG: alpha/beta fold hydrolase [Actinobacteria bacterium]|nr:MAG: alpha/beta fold hydrolase [Actinomycetota bacterium]